LEKCVPTVRTIIELRISSFAKAFHEPVAAFVKTPPYSGFMVGAPDSKIEGSSADPLLSNRLKIGGSQELAPPDADFPA